MLIHFFQITTCGGLCGVLALKSIHWLAGKWFGSETRKGKWSLPFDVHSFASAAGTAVHPAVTPSLVSLHVAPDAECFSTAGVRTAERLLARVAVRVDLETRRPAEGFVAGGADIAVDGLGKRSTRGARSAGLGRLVEEVVMFPWVRRERLLQLLLLLGGHGEHGRWEISRERLLMEKAGGCGAVGTQWEAGFGMYGCVMEGWRAVGGCRMARGRQRGELRGHLRRHGLSFEELRGGGARVRLFKSGGIVDGGDAVHVSCVRSPGE